jgi:hypothetical protein
LSYGEINLLRENEKALSWRNQQAGCGNTPMEKPISHNHRNRIVKRFTVQSPKVVKQFDSDPNWIARA